MVMASEILDPTPTPVTGCEAETVADAQKRFASLSPNAEQERDAALLEVARCHYREGRWREFFGLARYRRAFPNATEPSERLALLDVLASLRHCRFDRAKEVFSHSVPSNADVLKDERERIRIALAALPGDPKLAPKPGDKSKFAYGVKQPAMHWPVSFDDDRIRQSDPFRMQVGVPSHCTVLEATR